MRSERSDRENERGLSEAGKEGREQAGTGQAGREQALLDMGFPAETVRGALAQTATLVQALDWILQSRAQPLSPAPHAHAITTPAPYHPLTSLPPQASPVCFFLF